MGTPMKIKDKYDDADKAFADHILWCDKRKDAFVGLRVCACAQCPAFAPRSRDCFTNWLFLDLSHVATT